MKTIYHDRDQILVTCLVEVCQGANLTQMQLAKN